MSRIKLFLPLFLALVLSACTINTPTNKPKNNEPVVTPSSTPTPSPMYSVTFLKTPNVEKIWTEPNLVDIKIKNISVKPFITGLYINSCNFTDDTNTARQSDTQLGGGGNFKNAILPGEERILTNQQLSLDAGGITGLNAKGQECDYDANGKYSCKTVKGLMILNCKVHITGGEDSSPTIVNFP
jgi:hypothetical protein